MTTEPAPPAGVDAHLASVPCLEALLDGILAVLPDDEQRGLRFLDLGGGSGALSKNLLVRFPDCQCTLIEAAAPLCQAAGTQLAEFRDRLEVIEGDFTRIDLPQGHEAVVSLMRVHALADIDRRALYRSASSVLVPGGLLVIADEVRGASDELEALYQSAWRADAIGQGPAGGTGAPAPGDKGTTLVNELLWLNHVGFRDVDTYYKNMQYVVFGGRRPVATELSFSAGADDGAVPT